MFPCWPQPSKSPAGPAQTVLAPLTGTLPQTVLEADQAPPLSLYQQSRQNVKGSLKLLSGTSMGKTLLLGC